MKTVFKYKWFLYFVLTFLAVFFLFRFIVSQQIKHNHQTNSYLAHDMIDSHLTILGKSSWILKKISQSLLQSQTDSIDAELKRELLLLIYSSERDHIVVRSLDGNFQDYITKGTTLISTNEIEFEDSVDLSEYSKFTNAVGCQYKGQNEICLIHYTNHFKTPTTIPKNTLSLILMSPNNVIDFYVSPKTQIFNMPVTTSIGTQQLQKQTAYSYQDKIGHNLYFNTQVSSTRFYTAIVIVSLPLALVITLLIFVIYARAKKSIQKTASLDLLMDKLKNYENLNNAIQQLKHDTKSPLSMIEMWSAESDPKISQLLLKCAKEISLSIDEVTTKFGSQFGSSLLPCSLFLQAIARSMQKKHPTHKIICNTESNLWIKFSYLHFTRMIKNLINNSLEAADGPCEVTLTAKNKNGHIQISIRDNGKGIPEQIKNKIFDRGFTSGKPSGTGLGLWHAKTMVVQSNGSIQIRSQTGLGTEVQIQLESFEQPKWFTPKLNLGEYKKLILVDDDSYLNSYFEELCQKHKLEFVYLNSPDKLKTTAFKKQTSLILLDNSFHNQALKGFSIIQTLDNKNCYLFTNDWWNDELQSEMERTGKMMIPKDFVSFILN